MLISKGIDILEKKSFEKFWCSGMFYIQCFGLACLQSGDLGMKLRWGCGFLVGGVFEGMKLGNLLDTYLTIARILIIITFVFRKCI